MIIDGDEGIWRLDILASMSKRDQRLTKACDLRFIPFLVTESAPSYECWRRNKPNHNRWSSWLPSAWSTAPWHRRVFIWKGTAVVVFWMNSHDSIAAPGIFDRVLWSFHDFPWFPQFLKWVQLVQNSSADVKAEPRKTLRRRNGISSMAAVDNTLHKLRYAVTTCTPYVRCMVTYPQPQHHDGSDRCGRLQYIHGGCPGRCADQWMNIEYIMR